MDERDPPSGDGSRVVDIRGRPLVRPPAQNLAKYEGGDEPDDYRHRMVVNVIAFVFVIALIGGGLWLADTMAKMRKNQDCVLSGRRGCTPVDVSKDRW